MRSASAPAISGAAAATVAVGPDASDAEEGCEGTLRPGPMLADQSLAAGLEQLSQHERGHDDVVQLARPGDNVGNEIKREREIREKAREQHFPAPR
jgi:hypothetical protein